MTIYGVGYRALEFTPEPMRRRLAPLVSLEFRSLFRARFGVVLFIACLLPSIVSLVMLLVQMGVLSFGPRRMRGMAQGVQEMDGMGQFFATNVQFYIDPIVDWSFGPFLILSALVGSRAIAKDRAANALELYWTRGITPRGYLLAKCLGSTLLLCLMCVIAPFCLWVMGVFLAGDWTFLETTVKFMPRALLGLLLFTVLLGYLPVAFSALTGSPNLSSVMWCLLVAGSAGFSRILAEVTSDGSWIPAISVWDAAGAVAREVAGIAQPTGSFTSGLVALIAIAAGVTLFMLRRLRLQEAVG